ncbi:MAG: alpha/beta fold hydrolase [Chloroflexi bacterium]|nr:alpha/beta fold hydrolase [Chloroflexota bacterium]
MPWAKLEDNFEMFYEDDDFTDPWKTPETVVLHHGIGKNTRMWYGWAPALARHYRVVRLDARGFGQSQLAPPGYPWSLSNFARDISSLLDYLKLDKVHLLGETLGGTICMQFASEYPERLRSLAICTSPFRLTNPVLVEHADMIEHKGMMYFAQEGMARRLELDKMDPAFVEWYANEMGKTSARTCYELLRGVFGADLTDNLRKIEAPTVIITGESFFLYPSGETQEMQRLIPSARLKIIEGVTGLAHYAYPEKCAEAYLEFLRSLE